MSYSPPPKLTVGRIIGLGLLTVIVILLFWNITWRAANNRAIEQLEAAARQRGEPVTIKELAAAYPKVPDEENIHRALVKVWALEDAEYWNAYLAGTRPLPERQSEPLDERLPIVNGSRLDYGHELDAEQRAAMRKFLPEKKVHMDAVRAALRLKTYRANYDFDKTYAMLLPELAMLKREAQFFAIETLDAIAAKDNPRAIAAIGDITRVGECLKDDPLLINQLVRIACHQIALSMTERLLKERSLTSGECDQLEKIMSAIKQNDGMKRAMVSERAFAWSAMDGSFKELAGLMSSGSVTDSPFDTSMLGLRFMRLTGMMGADKRLMGETYDQIIRTLSKPDYAATDELHDIFESLQQKGRAFPPKILTLMLMPSLAKADQKASGLEALRRCVVTALAVERHRLSHQGALPAQLSELGSAVLIDPFSGKPLLFKKTERGYVVYSVGPDHEDNDALLDRSKAGSAGKYDLGFRVEHP